MAKWFLLIVMIGGSQLLTAQSVVDAWGEEIDPASIGDWKESEISAYSGAYKFGDSEWESDVFVLISGNEICIQQRAGEWVMDDQGMQ